MDIYDINRAAWNQAVSEGANPYTRGVSPQQVAEARRGRWSLYLSDRKPVPADWFPPLSGRLVLCLASGGGRGAAGPHPGGGGGRGHFAGCFPRPVGPGPSRGRTRPA